MRRSWALRQRSFNDSSGLSQGSKRGRRTATTSPRSKPPQTHRAPRLPAAHPHRRPQMARHRLRNLRRRWARGWGGSSRRRGAPGRRRWRRRRGRRRCWGRRPWRRRGKGGRCSSTITFASCRESGERRREECGVVPGLAARLRLEVQEARDAAAKDQEQQQAAGETEEDKQKFNYLRRFE